ncbi:MAG: HAMP domain-containing histidine kinase [Bacteroidetes bacterium]|jgi:signal transduction histidine kinase|nr:HAMP domain-containing histidine kinase [Bacteroidota bacterium]
MKLIARYNRVNLLTTIVVMLITGIVYYQVISLILIKQLEKNLQVEEDEIYEYVDLNHHLPQVFKSNDQQITFTEAKPGSVERHFINTVYHNFDNPKYAKRHPHRDDDEYETGRGLITSVTVGAKYYKVLIVVSTVEAEDLIQIIFGITAGVILLLFVTLYVTNRLLLNRLWQPFYDLLKELRLFDITDSKDIPLEKTRIDEFEELNQAIIGMSTRVKGDYKELKTFTENASHELLTPIAVINSKMDTLIQTDTFTHKQSKLLSDLYGAISKLTRLNQSLLLLVKIENRLLERNEHIDLKQHIEELLIQFEEIFLDKELMVSSDLVEKEVVASTYLIDILLNNLLGNAIRHNHAGGEIRVKLTSEALIVQNTGATEALQHDQIFTRFHKSTESEGSGLGLTISRQICENLNFTLNYSYQSSFHTFTVNF